MWSLSCCAKMGGDCEEVMEKVNSGKIKIIPR